MSFIEFCKTHEKSLLLTDIEIELYNILERYLNGLESFLDPCKGLFVRGGIGAGKTFVFKMAQKYKNGGFKFANASVVEQAYEEGVSMDKYYSGEWCFDDIGTEQKANNYGKGVEVFKRIIEKRYDF